MKWAIGAALAFAVGAVAWLFWSDGDVSVSESDSQRDDMLEGLEFIDGVHPDVRAFFVWWNEHGPFKLRIPSPFEAKSAGAAPAGIRSSEADQAAAAASGTSNAKTLAQTPHGRAAAVDAWPAEFNPHVKWESQPPEIVAQFLQYGELAEEHGLTWGGRWRSASMPNGDQPHVELKTWVQLPYPPPSGGYVA